MAKITKPKALGAEDLGVEILRSIEAEFRDADGRVLAVLGAAYLDSVLEQLLRATFVDDEKEADRLLAPDRPIGANGARYQLAYCLGLISADQRNDLKTIAKIRNLFAHDFSVVSLENDPVKALIKGLHIAKQREDIRKKLLVRDQTRASTNTTEKAGVQCRMILRDAVFDLFVVLIPKIGEVRRADAATWYGSEREYRAQ